MKFKIIFISFPQRNKVMPVNNMIIRVCQAIWWMLFMTERFIMYPVRINKHNMLLSSVMKPPVRCCPLLPLP